MEQRGAMQCPVCQTPLQMTERQGVEIDYCPQCRGVWLDRGELDKIIERSEGMANNPDAYYPDPGSGHQGGGHHGRGQQGGRRRGFWRDLFDHD